jgi:NAD(P)-dependent dehydrogenase (short-subunit alcohol dehydrogenase family)
VLAGARDPATVEPAENVIALELDVTDDDSVGAAIAGAEENPGSLDVLVNNAGIYGTFEGVAGYDLADAREVIETNVFGPWRLIQAALPLLRRSASPRIVNVSSGAGQLAEMGGGGTAYRLSKAALNALTRTMAADLEGSPILVNVVDPGWVKTRMGGRSAPRTPESAADAVLFLATLPSGAPSGFFWRGKTRIPW